MTFLDDLKKPFNLVTVFLAIGSILLSVYFWYNGEKRRAPTYRVHQTSQIVDQRIPSKKFSVINNLGQRIKENVYVVEISFWNSGRLPIDPLDVRIPVVIAMPSGAEIIDYSIIAESKPEISAFNVSELVNSTFKNKDTTIPINWKHLDPGLGARIQLFYSASNEVTPRIQGEILDASIVDGAGPLKRFGDRWVLILSGIVGAIIAFISITISEILSKGQRIFRQIILSFAIAAILLGFLYVINQIFLAAKIAPI